MSRSQEGLWTLFGTKKRSNNNSGSSSASWGGRTEYNNTSTEEAKVQTCEVIVTWKISEQNKVVVLYTEYAALSSKYKYKLGFYGKPTWLFEKGWVGWEVFKDKNSMEMALYVTSVAILDSTLAEILGRLSGTMLLHLSVP